MASHLSFHPLPAEAALVSQARREFQKCLEDQISTLQHLRRGFGSKTASAGSGGASCVIWVGAGNIRYSEEEDIGHLEGNQVANGVTHDLPIVAGFGLRAKLSDER
jgi:hypothetical protein